MKNLVILTTLCLSSLALNADREPRVRMLPEDQASIGRLQAKVQSLETQVKVIHEEIAQGLEEIARKSSSAVTRAREPKQQRMKIEPK